MLISTYYSASLRCCETLEVGRVVLYPGSIKVRPSIIRLSCCLCRCEISKFCMVSLGL